MAEEYTDVQRLLEIAPATKVKACLQGLELLIIQNSPAFANESRGDFLPALMTVCTIAGLTKDPAQSCLTDRLKQLTAPGGNFESIYGFCPKLITLPSNTQVIYLEATGPQSPGLEVQTPLFAFAYSGLGNDKPRVAFIRPAATPKQFHFATVALDQPMGQIYSRAIEFIFNDSSPTLTPENLSARFSHEAFIFQTAAELTQVLNPVTAAA